MWLFSRRKTGEAPQNAPVKTFPPITLNIPEHSSFFSTPSFFILNTKSTSYNIKEIEPKISYITMCLLLSLLRVIFYIQIQFIHLIFLIPFPVFPRTHYCVPLPPLLLPFSPLNKFNGLHFPFFLHTSLPPTNTKSFPFLSHLRFLTHCHHFYSSLVPVSSSALEIWVLLPQNVEMSL